MLVPSRQIHECLLSSIFPGLGYHRYSKKKPWEILFNICLNSLTMEIEYIVSYYYQPCILFVATIT